jgi:hypothetical protein
MTGKENLDPKAGLIARTQERLVKFGMLNLRTYDVFSIRRVVID